MARPSIYSRSPARAAGSAPASAAPAPAAPADIPAPRSLRQRLARRERSFLDENIQSAISVFQFRDPLFFLFGRDQAIKRRL